MKEKLKEYWMLFVIIILSIMIIVAFVDLEEERRFISPSMTRLCSEVAHRSSATTLHLHR